MDRWTVNRGSENLVDRACSTAVPSCGLAASHHLFLEQHGGAIYMARSPAAQAMDKKIMSVVSEEEKAETYPPCWQG